MRKKIGLIISILLLLVPTPVVAQVATTHISTGATLPTTCRVGDAWYKTGTSAGLYNCSATNTWTLVSPSTVVTGSSLTANRLIIGGGSSTIAALGSAGTTTTLLHGNASGAPTFGAVSLSADVTGNLPVTNLNSGTSASSSTFWRGDGTWATPGGGGTPGGSDKDIQYNNAGAFGGISPGTAGYVLTSNGASSTPSFQAATGGSGGAGAVVQVVNTQTGTVATGTTQIPIDNTIPQNTEGNQYMSLSITPTSSSNKLRIDAVFCGGTSFGAAWLTVALFQDSTANALAAVTENIQANGQSICIPLTHYMTAGTTSATTFKIRAGNNTGTTTTFNGGSSNQFFNGVEASSITITEINPSGSAGSVVNSLINGRLTTESGVCVSTSDRTSQGTIYWTPCGGNQIALYNGSAWTYKTFSELSLALSGLTSGKNYDVFIDYNSGTPQIVLSAAWSSDTARTDALALQDGIYVKSGTPAYRYVATIRTTSTTTTEDSAANRFVWNVYNRHPRALRAALETANSWTSNSTTWHQANGNSANQLNFVMGLAEDFVTASAYVTVGGSNTFSSSIGIGCNSTSSAQYPYGTSAGGAPYVENAVQSTCPPVIGYSFMAWLTAEGGNTTYFGDNNVPTYFQAGITGVIQN